jgi:hypothetical protein
MDAPYFAPPRKLEKIVMKKMLCAAALLVCAGLPALAQDRPKLQTSQEYLEELYRGAKAPLDDRKAMLAFVLQSLPERVKVYPTENYYYFGFYSGGVRYAGNIRLDASDRDKGKLHFAYYIDNVEWRDEEFPVNYALMGAEEGVNVEKVERFLYRVTAGGKSVLFELNDLSNVRPPEQAISPDEKFLGPVFDESGIRFFLVYNAKLKIFHYILDETVPVPDQLTRVKATDRIEIGTRTGFAFYRDQRRERRILIGVYEGNVLANNFFDGPFDQLPDNFLQGDELLQAILDVAPTLKGTLDRFGGSLDGSERFLIAPYANYRQVTDLLPIHACAIGPRGKGERYYECFDAEEPTPPPNAPAKQRPQPKGKGAPK